MKSNSISYFIKLILATEKMAKKLRILCLHGFNTTKAIMKFQMANFTQAFDSICEFVFIEAPSDC